MYRKLGCVAVLCVAAAGCSQPQAPRTYFVSGVIRTDYPSGKIQSEASIKSNLLDGPSTSYYENGVKMSEATYHSGLLDGKSLAYYPGGAKKAEASYKMGLLNGTSISWSEQGQVLSTVEFVDGRVVEKTSPNPATTSTSTLRQADT